VKQARLIKTDTARFLWYVKLRSINVNKQKVMTLNRGLLGRREGQTRNGDGMSKIKTHYTQGDSKMAARGRKQKASLQ
jgi:hypothetical protein